MTYTTDMLNPSMTVLEAIKGYTEYATTPEANEYALMLAEEAAEDFNEDLTKDPDELADELEALEMEAE